MMSMIRIQDLPAEAAATPVEESAWYSLDALGQWMISIAPSALTALVLFFVMMLCASWLQRIVRTAMERAKVEQTLSRFFGKLARWAVIVVGILLILGEFGIETASFAVVIGALGLAVGLALQGTLGNFAAGVLLLVFRPYKIGDVVKVAGELGKVFEIDLFSTVLDSMDNRRILIPNGAILAATIENITHNPFRRVEVKVGADYAASVAATRAALEQVAAAVPQRDPELGHRVVLFGLGGSAVDWQVWVWCRSADYLDCLEATVTQVKRALDEAGIGIPFPQLDVRLKGAEAVNTA